MKAIKVLFNNSMLLLFLGLLSSKSYAVDGSSGCGAGWYVLKENSLLSSFGRSLTNVISSPIYTLGMTFGTSNCAKHSIVEEHKRSLHFATQSFDVLRHDLVKGHGIHEQSFLQTFGCNDLVKPAVARSLQRGLAQNPSVLESPEQLVIMTQGVIYKEPFFAMQCT